MVFWIILGILIASFVFIMWGPKNKEGISAARAWLIKQMTAVKNWVVSKIRRK